MPRSKPELPECLTIAAGLRVPLFQNEESVSPTFKVRQLENYLLLSAYYQGDLSEERLQWLVKLVPIKDCWDHLVGWEQHQKGRTNEAVSQAKRLVAPVLYDELAEVEWMISRLGEEIDRLERDATKVSRAYAMVTGS